MSLDLLSKIDSHGHLNLRDAGLEKIDLSPLRGCTSLRSLDLSENRRLVAINITTLTSCPNLDSIHLDAFPRLMWNGSYSTWNKEARIIRNIRSSSINLTANIQINPGDRGRIITQDASSSEVVPLILSEKGRISLDSIIPPTAESFELNVRSFESGTLSSSFDLDFGPQDLIYPNLRHLWLSCTGHPDELRVSNRQIVLSSLVYHFPNLETLGFIWPQVELQTTGAKMPHLQELTLGMTRNTTLDLSFLRKSSIRVIRLRKDNMLKTLDLTPLLHCQSFEILKSPRLISGTLESEAITLLSRENLRERVLPLWDNLDKESKKEVQSYLGRDSPVQLETSLEEDPISTRMKLFLEGKYQMERAAKNFTKLPEEPLRSTIQMKFKDATAESLSVSGRVDISQPLADLRRLESECKKWKGQQYYRKGIKQLLKNLTLRDDHAVYITFVDRGTFAKMVQKAKDAIRRVTSYVPDSIKYIEKGYFITKHLHPSDPETIINVHHILVNLIVKP